MKSKVIKKFICLFFVSVLLLILVACGVSRDYDLVGTWVSSSGAIWRFYEDGVGDNSFSSIDQFGFRRDLSDLFEWYTQDGQLRTRTLFIDLDRVDRRQWRTRSYQVDGDILILGTVRLYRES